MKLLGFAAAAFCAAIITLAASLPANALSQGPRTDGYRYSVQKPD
jgi:hypothetical protein